ncbi:FecR domain-containing protein [Marinibaculum pumilum]|uniref:FecR domain-containing protein n=1 Tax=Marinibaculum pumilum TaxID=1766165 RepID=A0ABV7L775_9PROT
MRTGKLQLGHGLRAASLIAAGVGLLAAQAVPSLAASKIGVTAAVNPDAEGTPPDAATRVLYVGIDMQADERVTTSADGRAQLLFLDGSAMSVGPNSDLVLDRFVYDPATDTGDLAVTVGRGVFRFVGGRISKREAVKIETGSATIGIRGGIAMINVGDGGDVQSSFLFGDEMTVTSAGQTQRTNMPGTAIEAGAGQPPQPPRILSRGEITSSLAAFNGRPPGSGGRDGAGAAGGQGGNRGAAGNGRSGNAQAGTSTGAAARSGTRQAEAARNLDGDSSNDRIGAGDPTQGQSGDADVDPDRALVSSGVSGSASSEQPSGVDPVTPEGRQAGSTAGSRPPPTESGSTAEGAGGRSVADAGAERRSSEDAIADFGRLEQQTDQTVAEGSTEEEQDGLPAPSPTVAGRLLRDPVFDGIDTQTLAVQFLGDNTPFLATAEVAGGRIRPVTVTGAAFDFPYQATGSEYAVSAATATGPFDSFSGRMYVAADGSFWRVAGTGHAAGADGGAHEFILFGGTQTTLAQLPTSGTTALAIGGLLAPLPFLGGDLPIDSQSAGIAVSPFYLRHGPGIAFSQRQAGAAPPLGYQASLMISGTGAAQTSFMAGAVATIVEEGSPGSGLPALSGRLRGSYKEAGHDAPVALRSSLSSVGLARGSAVFGDAGQYLVLNPSALTMNPQTGQVTRQTAAMLARQPDGLVDTDDDYFVLAAQPGGTTPDDFLQSRTSRSMRGFTGGTGFVTTGGETGGAVFIDTGAFGSMPGGLSLQTDSANGTVTASMVLADVLGGSARVLYFGGDGNGTTAQPSSALIDDDRYIALESPTYNAVTGTGQTAKSQDLVLVTAASVDPAQLGLQPCECAFLDWGFWSGAVSLQDDSEERYHMASWVAGELPSLAQIPTTGTASYGGHIIGSVFNDGANYIAAGQMGANWNFAERAGGFEVTGFDAANYTGQLVSQDGRAIVGAGQTADAARQMALNGAFFAGGGNPVAAMGGHFIVQNASQSYAGGGTWALDQVQ